MSRLYPALDVVSPRPLDGETADRLLAEVDEEHPVAVEGSDNRLRIFFTTAETRGRAAVRLIALEPDLTCTPVDVSDEDWAERSQAALEPVRVGRLVIAPPWRNLDASAGDAANGPPPIIVRIQPSMGFGTGHHATTRLCLRLLQAQDISGTRVLDVGTGSGVLAIASSRLGASETVAIDHDPDALQSATENINLNGAERTVRAVLVDLDQGAALSRLGVFDIVLANLTGAMLSRQAPTIAGVVTAGGRLIASGLMTDEAAAVQRAFESGALQLDARVDEDEWVALAFTNPSASTAR